MSQALTIQPPKPTRATNPLKHSAPPPAIRPATQQAGQSINQSAEDQSQRITAAIARGDSSAFGLFYDTWFTFAFAEAQRYTQRDEATCLDIVQDAMLKAARSMKPLDTKSDVERWLTRVVQTAALDTLRQEKRRRQREATALANGGHKAAVDQRAAQEHVRRAWLDDQVEWLSHELAKIPASDRALLHLRFALGRSLEQTGKAVGISGDAAHGKLRRIIARLKGRSENES